MKKTRQPVKVYVDTSVFGGVFDKEFENASVRFFDLVLRGVFSIFISPLVTEEMVSAPLKVRAFFDSIRPDMTILQYDDHALDLRAAYIQAGVITDTWDADALHVAMATAGGCAMIVSWNFKHIVSYHRIPLYNRVNVKNGFCEIGIYTPLEVSTDE